MSLLEGKKAMTIRAKDLIDNPLARKLGLLPGGMIAVLNNPAGAMTILQAAAPAGTTIHTTIESPPYDLILCWPQSPQELGQQFQQLQDHIRPDGALWMLIPKKKFAKQRGITFTWEEMQAAGLQTKLVDNKIAAFSDQDYATRFVIRREFRPVKS